MVRDTKWPDCRRREHDWIVRADVLAGYEDEGVMTQGLVVDEQYLSFGEAWEDQEFGWILRIRNTTNQNVEIEGFTTSCSCARIDPKSLTIPAHGTVEVRLTLNLHIPNNQPDVAEQDFTVYVKPLIKNGPAPHSSWTIQGKVRKAFQVEPEKVDYEGRLVEGIPFQPRKVKITPLVPLQKVQATCDPNEASIELKKMRQRGMNSWFAQRIGRPALSALQSLSRG